MSFNIDQASHTVAKSVPDEENSSISSCQTVNAVAAVSSKKTYVCTYCSKVFTKPSALRPHIYSHTGEKPFACTIGGCERRFSVISNLRRHWKSHQRKLSREAYRISGDRLIKQIKPLPHTTSYPSPEAAPNYLKGFVMAQDVISCSLNYSATHPSMLQLLLNGDDGRSQFPHEDDAVWVQDYQQPFTPKYSWSEPVEDILSCVFPSGTPFG
ncbi:uncharacterized protein BYT42DRAFT_610249 [Radiomyces spectabilis]|uniref:uncharacterized protein n=1 Tax=Radiomyces spectabilis TaxID=64574 RepID=UPI00221F7836|nr:uncharacterized protein BYT42DRAFT_610249 [Radiomyces spectabilis]KAI8390981.1 hypothetical protein BYT42DRAFT_610249 [Radiomyces spectabilis]